MKVTKIQGTIIQLMKAAGGRANLQHARAGAPILQQSVVTLVMI